MLNIFGATNKVKIAVDTMLKEEIIPLVFVQRVGHESARRAILVLPKDKLVYFHEVWNDYEIFKYFETEEIEDFVKERFPNLLWEVFKLEVV